MSTREHPRLKTRSSRTKVVTRKANEVTAPDAAKPSCMHSGGHRPGTGEFFRSAKQVSG
jgi:hypothetical protein